MRLLISLLVGASLYGQPAATVPGGFSVIGQDPGAWPQILSSIGLHPSSAAEASVYVARAGAPSSPNWGAKLEAGAFVIVEGDSPLARSFGFHTGSQTIQLATLNDVHEPKLPLIFEKPLEVAQPTIPREARVFAAERWNKTPAIAGFRRGRGAVLWVIASPGTQGFERFPFLPQAMTDLGFEPPFRGNRTWAFFDYSYRTRVDLDYFAAKWHAAGISALQVAAWHFYDRDPVRDAYLVHLLEACHRSGIAVYAWLEIPHVSEKFWANHPEWREKTAVLQDAQLDWRKLMNLADPNCFRAVSAGVSSLIAGFDWDGINLAELYYESLEGAENPARFTPMNDTVRAAFAKTPGGFDPLELWSSRNDAASLRSFLDYRAGLAREMQEQWLLQAEGYRKLKPDLDIVLTHVDDRFDTGMRDAIGADTSQILSLLKAHDFTFLIEDPATVWNLGPKRYPEIAKRYPASPKLAIDINVVDRYQDVYPAKQQTGIELFELVHLATASFPRVALYFENSLLAPDVPLLSAASAAPKRVTASGRTVVFDSDAGLGVRWTGTVSVDGRPWPITDGRTVWLPSGTHSVASDARIVSNRVTSFNGLLRSASISGKRLELSYQSASRAFAVMEHSPSVLEIDGIAAPIHLAGSTLILPRGQHFVSIQ